MYNRKWLKNFPYDKIDSLLLQGAVWDIEKGTVLKLTENKIITKAMNGMTLMTEAEIKEMYGDPPIFE